MPPKKKKFNKPKTDDRELQEFREHIKIINEKTKAIVAVHYAGVPCEMDVLMRIANSHNLIVIEDAAQAINSSYIRKTEYSTDWI